MDFGSPVSPNDNFIWRIPDLITPVSEKRQGSMFEPQVDITGPLDSTRYLVRSNISRQQGLQEAPEKKLTLLALRLALFEKTASGLGALGFIWATVVLLGGFASTIESTDFWFVTIILLIEGGRLYSRSHELEWQHESKWSLSEAGKRSFRALRSRSKNLIHKIKGLQPVTSSLPSYSRKPRITRSNTAAMPDDQNPERTWSTSEVPLVPYAGWFLASRNISKLLYWFQLAAAASSVALSASRLHKANFVRKGEEIQNEKAALIIFYALALAEAFVFLLEKAYWEWKVRFMKSIEQVNKECGFDDAGIGWIRRFFYDSYSRCLNGSIFDGLKMDLLSFAAELLQSDSVLEQLTGARMLMAFTVSDRFAADAFRRIGTSAEVMERLVEMLSWRSHREMEIRMLAAIIVSKITGKKQNSLRVAGIPGAIESISSLLQSTSTSLSDDGVQQKQVAVDETNYDHYPFNLIGLLILKKLANEHDNCGKIGSARGLLTKIVDFTHTGERMLRNNNVAESQLMRARRALKLVRKLAATTGSTGVVLRQEISCIVFSISYLRDILQYGERHNDLQLLAIDILTSMALDKDAKEKIGSTGGMISLLFGIFLNGEILENDGNLRVSAGGALAMLALEDQQNCERMLKLDVIGKLVVGLNDKSLSINSARILRNLCAYIGSDCQHKMTQVTEAADFVLRAIMSEEPKTQEVAIGLAAQVFRFTDALQFHRALSHASIRKTELPAKLVQILRNYPRPSVMVPRIRRFVVELVITMMRAEKGTRTIFKTFQLANELNCVAATTSELECFSVFSGTVGLSRHGTSLHSLLDEAHELLNAA
ncbi:uncharacterized protein LOC116259793 [Nymphaea colorata]|nr:uncharacterized protein LOC116259793 [Nymphaea colorata]